MNGELEKTAGGATEPMTVVNITDRATPPDRPSHGEAGFLAALAPARADAGGVAATAKLMASAVMEGLDAAGVAVFLIDKNTGELARHAAAGAWTERAAPVRVDHGPLARCLRDGEVEIADGMISAPLRAAGTVIGAVLARRRPARGFDRRDAARLEALATYAGLALDNARLRERLAEGETTARELELAAEIQRNLLPAVDTDRWPVFGLNRPIHQVSGDFFDFFALPDGRIPFALGDVSGKGINAALLMAKAASLFRCLGKRHDDPAAILDSINREICETVTRGMFVTMVAGIYDPRAGRARIANAGHEPPLLRLPERSYRTFPASAPPLGILPDVTYSETEIGLAGGELYMFSDGLTEFGYRGGEQLGVEGLIQMVEALADLPIDARLKTLLAELDREGWRVRDDLTVLAIDDAWTPGHGGSHAP